MSNDTTQRNPADVRDRIIRASILPFEDEETMIAGLRAGAEAVERGELDVDDFVGVWSQYLRELFRRASSVPTLADLRERIRDAIREGVRYMAKADGAYLYAPSVDETADRILSLLRTPRGEGEDTIPVSVLRSEIAQLKAHGLLPYLAWARLCALAGGGPVGEDTPAALRSEAQGEDRWEDLVFGPITQAYNEAHAARRSDAQEGEEDALVCASCGERIGDEPTVIWQDAYTHYRCTPEDAIRDDTPVIRPIDAARRGEGGGNGLE